MESIHPLSTAAAGLVAALVARSGSGARLRHHQSTEWKSLTFAGEHHVIRFVADERAPLEQMLAGLDDAEFSIPGAIVTDVAASQPIAPTADKLWGVEIEALTVEDLDAA